MIAPVSLAPTLVSPLATLAPVEDRTGTFDAMLASLAPAAGGTLAAPPSVVVPVGLAPALPPPAVPERTDDTPVAAGADDALPDTGDQAHADGAAVPAISPEQIAPQAITLQAIVPVPLPVAPAQPGADGTPEAETAIAPAPKRATVSPGATPPTTPPVAGTALSATPRPDPVIAMSEAQGAMDLREATPAIAPAVPSRMVSSPLSSTGNIGAPVRADPVGASDVVTQAASSGASEADASVTTIAAGETPLVARREAAPASIAMPFPARPDAANGDETRQPGAVAASAPGADPAIAVQATAEGPTSRPLRAAQPRVASLTTDLTAVSNQDGIPTPGVAVGPRVDDGSDGTATLAEPAATTRDGGDVPVSPARAQAAAGAARLDGVARDGVDVGREARLVTPDLRSAPISLAERGRAISSRDPARMADEARQAEMGDLDGAATANDPVVAAAPPASATLRATTGPATPMQGDVQALASVAGQTVAPPHRRPAPTGDDIAAITGLDLDAVFPRSGDDPLTISYPGDPAGVRAAAALPQMVAPAAPAVTASAAVPTDIGITHHLEVAHDGAWLDRLARDISLAGDREQRMRFQLNPERLGALTVDIAPAGDGAAVRFTADNEAARAMIADAQPRLIAEARSQGARIADMQVDLSGGQGGGVAGGQGGAANPFAQGQNQQGHNQQGQSRQAAPRGFAAERAQAAPRIGTAANAERYA